MAVDRYPFSEIEAKWQQLWEEKDLFKVTLRVDNPMRLYWT
jgi:leucyl-tRNA synthetase